MQALASSPASPDELREIAGCSTNDEEHGNDIVGMGGGPDAGGTTRLDARPLAVAGRADRRGQRHPLLRAPRRPRADALSRRVRKPDAGRRQRRDHLLDDRAGARHAELSRCGSSS